MPNWFRRNPTFPASLLAEAKRFPNANVYEIDSRFERDGAIPPWAVLRGWKIDGNGCPTGEVIENPNANRRAPLGSVEQLLAEVAVLHREGREFELFVSPQTTFNDEPVPLDVAMAIIGDKVLSIGFWPAGRRDFEGGFAYRYQRNAGSHKWERSVGHTPSSKGILSRSVNGSGPSSVMTRPRFEFWIPPSQADSMNILRSLHQCMIFCSRLGQLAILRMI
jgi:hypothetical protein